MDEQQKCQCDGDSVYLLDGTGKFYKGLEHLQNRLCFRILGSLGTTGQEREALAERIKNLVNKELLEER